MTQETENKRMYDEREKRVMDTVALKKTDRVPIASLADFFMPTCQGVSCKDVMYDYDKTAEAYKKTMKEFNWDMAPPTFVFTPGKVLDLMGIKYLNWPGAANKKRRLPDHLSYQYVEKEYLLADEVDDFLKDPTDFTVRKLMPRFASTMEPLEALPLPISFFCGWMTSRIPGMAIHFSDVWEKLVEAAAENKRWIASQFKLVADIKEMGYPLLHSLAGICAFDFVADNYRGMKGTMLDMYRQPDKLLALVKYFEPMMSASVIMAAKRNKNLKRVFIPLHKGAEGFMSKKQFERFYWPQLKRLFTDLIEAGLTPEPFLEGNYTGRLEYLAELAPGKIMGHYDTIDRHQHKEILSHTMCFWGDIPAGLLIGGTVNEVKDYVKELIDFFPDGGLIVDGSAAGIPLESKKENVVAMTETVFEYGQY